MTGTIAIVQARMSSTRLPGKVLLDIAGKPALQYTLSRASRAQTLDQVWLACSEQESDDDLAEFGEGLGYPVFRGDELDVLSRFSAVARETDAELIVRLTGDCPMIDPSVIDLAVGRIRETKVDYVSNHLVRSYPDGLDVEVMTRAALMKADTETDMPFLRAHVTPYIHGRLKNRLPWGEFETDNFVHATDFSHLRWTLDETDDLLFLRRLFAVLPDDFHWLDAIAAMTRHPELFWINRKHDLHEGTENDLLSVERPPRRFEKSNQQLARSLETVPLASQTFSKSYQQWVCGATPLFIESGHGCRVRDLDGNSFIDYIQGLLPNILGYCDPDVDMAIRNQLDRGITFSLPSTLEYELAERLVRDIPCAEMVRYGKNGSDATTAAIRLARAFTGRDKVAVAGYHGWHDWYIGTTTRSLGVPDAISSLSETFAFNDASALEGVLQAEPDAFAAVILEPTGAVPVAEGFLQRLRELTEKYGVIMVFDEIITGFRVHKGGAQARLGVTPDLACFGKSMANGMPLSTIVGRRDIMMLMEEVFVSGTFGGETLSLAASIATIDKIAREDVIERLWARGARLIDESNKIFDKHGLTNNLGFRGEGWWPRLHITDPPVEPNLMTSLLRQAFVSNGMLLASSYNLSIAHDSDAVMNETLVSLDSAIAEVRSQLDSSNPSAALRGERVQPTFAVR